jgi:hypothetical protein
MDERFAKTTIAVGLLLLSGCYHAVVETGRAPSGQEVRREWASSWLAGLVPPSATTIARECPNGIARVETKLSFLNQVAAGLTLGIYTPMDVRVRCAASESALEDAERVPLEASLAEARQAVSRAATRSAASGTPVIVVFETRGD